MKHASTLLSRVWRMLAAPLALVLAALAAPAHADEYADVNQLVKSGKPSEALHKADLYLAGKPRDPQMRFIKGVILTDLGRPADAMAVFQALTQDYPELPEPYNNLAALYAQQNQFDKARTALEMAVRVNPNYAVAHENLGDIYARLAGQSYARASQIGGSNATLNSKITAVRTLFAPPQTAAPARK